MSQPTEPAAGKPRDPKQLSLGVANFVETEPPRTTGERAVVAQSKKAAGTVPGETRKLSPTRRRLVSEETDPQMVLVRLLEDARWIQRGTRAALKETEGETIRLNLLKLFWSVRTELVKMLQGLGVLPRELFFEDEGNDFDHLPTEVAETISGLLSGRIEPNQAPDGPVAP